MSINGSYDDIFGRQQSNEHHKNDKIAPYADHRVAV